MARLLGCKGRRRFAGIALAGLLLVACADCEPCACGDGSAILDGAASGPGSDVDAPGPPPDAMPDAVPDSAEALDAVLDTASDTAPDTDAAGAQPDARPRVEVLPAPSEPCWDDDYRGDLCSTCNARGDCRAGLDCLDADGDPATARVCTRACADDSECGPDGLCRVVEPTGRTVCRCGGCAELSVRPGVTCIPSDAETQWRHPSNGRWYPAYEIPDDYATATWGSNPLVPLCWGSWVWTAAPPDSEAWWTMPDGTWCRQFRRRFSVPEGARVCLSLSADDRAQVRLNGRLVARHAVAAAGGAGGVTGVALLPEPGVENELEFCVCSTTPSYAGLLFNVHYR